MQTPNINSKKEIRPKIYAYRTPRNQDTKDFVNIGYTERLVDIRIREQTRGIYSKKIWHHPARYQVGDKTHFKDHDFHRYLVRHGIPKKNIYGATEWFDFGKSYDKSEEMFIAFTQKKSMVEFEERDIAETYILREEQEEAVGMTKNYFNDYESAEFLWNAKPRFGKTLAAYDLIKEMKFENILILTNRPAIGHSWINDYEKFIKYDKNFNYYFVSDSPALKNRLTMSREEYEELSTDESDNGQIAFVSLQDLHGSIYFSDNCRNLTDKLRWIKDTEWDLIIIDEAHEAADTSKAKFALERINKKYILYLSGTPFRLIAKDKFDSDQIYNWSYMDEQEAKINWDRNNSNQNNPYQELPTLNMYTYQMSNMIIEELKKGADLDGEKKVDYAFDLNTFFSTNSRGNLIYEKDIIRWLDSLTSNFKYPFSTKELRNELKHTLWLLKRVDSVEALARLLKDHPVFGEYEIVSVAGDGEITEIDGEKIEVDSENIYGRNNALDRVKKAIREHDKTITLTVGQLTTGVTVPGWSGVLMLSNVESPSRYMQTAFRVQNSHSWTERDKNNKPITYRKQNAYVFDFAPERTLQIIDKFANDLSGNEYQSGEDLKERKQNINRLLNFFPVIGEDIDGEMSKLDAEMVMTLPKRFQSNKVFRRGFKSNLLFQNISSVFRSNKALEIINNFSKTEEGKSTVKKGRINPKDLEDIGVGKDGNTYVEKEEINKQLENLFGEKIFSQNEIEDVIKPEEIELTSDIKIQEKIRKALIKELKYYLYKVRTEYNLTHAQRKKKQKSAEEEINKSIKKLEEKLRKFQAERKDELIDKGLLNNVKDIEKENKRFIKDFYEQLKSEIEEVVNKISREIIESEEIQKKEKKRKTVEEDIREKLRGFTRNIPSFIMAYGDETLRLDNFEEYVESKVFYEVTGISLEDFIFLRDGRAQEFDGDLINAIVFNDAVQEFLRKKEELDNFFEDFEDTEESIFDYIPPQNTNQIYTPKWVVQKMVNDLEEQNPGIYDDSSKTFIDLYMKSGLYITEIVKKLYSSEQIKEEFPNDEDRIKHILEDQVYGFAPSKIIYDIAIRFIFGEFDDEISQKNFLQVDTTPYAKAGTMQELINEKFGD